MYLFNSKSCHYLCSVYLSNQSSRFVVAAGITDTCFGCSKATIIRLYVSELYTYSYIIFLFYISETYGLMMVALVQLKHVAI